MAILVGIDGTGSAVVPGKSRDAKYDIAFAKSFVKTICNAGGSDALYERGPVALGGGLMNAISSGFNHVVNKRRISPSKPVLLTGYSRGAAGVVSLAKRLKDKNIPVQALLLFDCVDRHVGIDASVIPDNVQNVLHVVRDPDSSSRESFGNDGLTYYPAKTKYWSATKFMCTHGAMGGCPWEPDIKNGEKYSDFINEGFGAGSYDGATKITFAMDKAASEKVWQFCQPFITTFKFMG